MQSFFNENFRLKWAFHTSCFAHSYMFVTKGPTKFGLFLIFLRGLWPLFLRERAYLRRWIFLGPTFLKTNHEPFAHDAHIIFRFPAIILLAVLASRSLLFAHRYFLFFVRWPLTDIADRFLLFAGLCSLIGHCFKLLGTRWTQLADRCWVLAPCWSLLTTHCSRYFKLLACWCWFVVCYLRSRLSLFWKGPQPQRPGY